MQVQQLAWFQHFALLRDLIEPGARVGQLPQGDGGAFEEQKPGFRGFTLLLADLGEIAEGEDGREERLPERRAHALADQAPDCIEL
jgi:hypothetical protein